jgi:hypothetical protein
MTTKIKFKKSELKEYFKSDKLNDPLSGFYLFLVNLTNNEESLLSGKRVDITKVQLNKKQYKKEVYEKILSRYVKKKSGEFTKRYLLELSLYDLDIGPATNDEVPENEIWLLDGWLYE